MQARAPMHCRDLTDALGNVEAGTPLQLRFQVVAAVPGDQTGMQLQPSTQTQLVAIGEQVLGVQPWRGWLPLPTPLP